MYLSSIKVMEETDVSVQVYSFLELTAVCYDEKANKDGHRCDFCDTVIRKVLCLTVQLNQPASNTIDSPIQMYMYMFSKYGKPFPSKVNDSVYSENIFVKRHANNSSNLIVSYQHLINGL